MVQKGDALLAKPNSFAIYFLLFKILKCKHYEFLTTKKPFSFLKGFPSSGSWINSFQSLVQKEDALLAKPNSFAIYFLLFKILKCKHYEFLTTKKPFSFLKGFPSSGSWTRTSDLWVMSPTSYLLLYPAMWVQRYTLFRDIDKGFFIKKVRYFYT